MLELKLDLRFSDYKITSNGGACEGCTAPMKDPSKFCDDAIFRNEELWESEHALDSTQGTRRILDANYQMADLSKIVSNIKQLNHNKKSMLRDV